MPGLDALPDLLARFQAAGLPVTLARTGPPGVVARPGAAPGLDVAGDAGDGHEAVALAARLRPDVVLMDIRMPRPRRRGRHRAHRRRVARAAAGAHPDHIRPGRRRACGGASGFLLKDIEPEPLLAAVHATAAGDRLFAPTVTRRLVEADLG